MSILELTSAKRVRLFRFIREEEALNLVRSVASLADADSIVNLSWKFLQLTNDISARVIIESKCKYQKNFLRIMAIQLKAAGGFGLVDLFPSSSLVRLISSMTSYLQRVHQEVDMILGSIIQDHKQGKAMLTARSDGMPTLFRPRPAMPAAPLVAASLWARRTRARGLAFAAEERAEQMMRRVNKLPLETDLGTGNWKLDVIFV
ncbi:premnaspirodiene oxygenase-like [Canna indica]|uniref:Premnaspirodiene oxygenase-like n=1 Tax=Canna indica TaxID=4628 RepID=A0AAQ3Q4U7_9LILI|nr:premnaspirodiene oxygenase-like [Canna indica]